VADTGAPWFIPFAEPTDLVRDWPDLSEDVADAVAAGLSAAGGLVAVKSALFTGTQTNSTTAGANFAVTDLTITHAVAEAGNKLIISAYLGAAGSSNSRGNVGIAVMDGSTLIAVGAADGFRTPVGAGGSVQGTGVSNSDLVVTMPSVTFVYEPADDTSRTYTVRAISIAVDTATIYINRSQNDGNAASGPRGTSALVIQEVKV
jgi:hypothetical protein